MFRFDKIYNMSILLDNKPRIGIVNSGGDAPGLNTVIDGLVRALGNEYQILGFIKGYEGLIDKNYMILDQYNVAPFKFSGGTILRTVNKGRFASKTGGGEKSGIDPEVLESAKLAFNQLGLECIVALGGDGSMATACQLIDYGLNIVGVPKSIDNDLAETDYTFGFHTAVDVATIALDNLKATGASHDRIMVLEVMGRYTGWISLYAGIAGGASLILIPEISFDWQKIVEVLEYRVSAGKFSTAIIVAEGAKPKGGNFLTKDIGSKASEVTMGGIGEQITEFINKNTHFEARNTVLGYIQRGQIPNSFDRLLSRQFAVEASKLVRAKKYGHMVQTVNGKLGSVEIEKCVSKLKAVPLNHHLITTAKGIGISFGD
jgi:6-phosphofructokinase 1